jgi:restriction system protein
LNALITNSVRAARIAQRYQAQQVRAQTRVYRDAERARKALDRAHSADAKERQRLYVESRLAGVEAQNAEIEEHVRELSEMLRASVQNDSSIDFKNMLVVPTFPTLELGDLSKSGAPPNRYSYMPLAPNWLLGWLPSVKRSYAKRCQQGEQAFLRALEGFQKIEQERLQAIESKKHELEMKVHAIREEAERQNEEVRRFQAEFEAGEPQAIASYFMLVLSRSSYPVGFPQTAKVLYIAESKQLLVQYDLPALSDVIPPVRGYKYIKTSDSVTEAARPESQCRSLYATVVAQTVLRSLNEVFHADHVGHIETAVLNAHVSAIDPGTGHRVKPCLVTVRTTKDTFRGLDLSNVEPSACLRTLNASVSKSPAELAPVRPIVEFNMMDPRFIEEADVLSTLDQRKNLMDLSPGEFESLITNLFEKMGLETRQTQASRDGGVDCVAYDPSSAW